MRSILDTCTLIWLSTDPKKLSRKAVEIIDSDDVELLISHVSVWEMSLKIRSGKMTFPKPLRRWLHEQKNIWRFDWIPINLNHILFCLELQNHHNDPFDRMLIAQAIEENIPVLTPDSHIKQYPVEVIW